MPDLVAHHSSEMLPNPITKNKIEKDDSKRTEFRINKCDFFHSSISKIFFHIHPNIITTGNFSVESPV